MFSSHEHHFFHLLIKRNVFLHLLYFHSFFRRPLFLFFPIHPPPPPPLLPLSSTAPLLHLTSSPLICPQSIIYLQPRQSLHLDRVIKYLCGHLNPLKTPWQSPASLDFPLMRTEMSRRPERRAKPLMDQTLPDLANFQTAV